MSEREHLVADLLALAERLDGLSIGGGLVRRAARAIATLGAVDGEDHCGMPGCRRPRLPWTGVGRPPTRCVWHSRSPRARERRRAETRTNAMVNPNLDGDPWKR